MIFNPVRYVKSGAKTVEVTYTTNSSGTHALWVDESNELQDTTGKTNSIFPTLGSIFILSVEPKTITNASLIYSSFATYAYRADA